MSPLAYSVPAAANVCGLSASQLKRAIEAGDLKAKASSFRADGRVAKYVIRHADLAAYIDGLEDA